MKVALVMPGMGTGEAESNSLFRFVHDAARGRMWNPIWRSRTRKWFDLEVQAFYFDAEVTLQLSGKLLIFLLHQFNDKLGGFIGGAAYNFKFTSGWDMTPEIYGGLVLYVTGTPTLYYARDFDLTTGDHTVLTLTHGVPAGTNVTVQATGRIEYNNGYYRFPDESRSSFSYADLNVSVPISLGKITITPMVILVGALADDFEDRVIGGVKAHFAIQ